jgi:hypothetical protein
MAQDEEMVMVEYEGKEEERAGILKVIEDYFPEGDDITEKGNLTRKLPYSLSVLEKLPMLFPELEENEQFLKSFIRGFEKRRISINRGSREEFTDIQQAIVGSISVEDDGKGGGMSELFKNKEAKEK